jgi:hypothetical protein
MSDCHDESTATIYAGVEKLVPAGIWNTGETPGTITGNHAGGTLGHRVFGGLVGIEWVSKKKRGKKEEATRVSRPFPASQ